MIPGKQGNSNDPSIRDRATRGDTEYKQLGRKVTA